MATTNTIGSATRWEPRTCELDLDVTGVGAVPLHLGGRDRTRPFLLLHGGAGPASVTSFADLLAAREHARVLVPTHPGFDGTPRPGGVETVADLAGVYVSLIERLDLWDVTVIGNSLGGWIALEIALRAGPRVSGAVIVDAVGTDLPGHPVADVRELAPAELVARSFHDPTRFAGSSPAPSPDLVAANLAALYTYGGETMADPTLPSRLAELHLPVQVVWGEADRIVTPTVGRALADAIPGSRFTVLPRAGHLPQVETPEELLATITDPTGDPR